MMCPPSPPLSHPVSFPVSFPQGAALFDPIAWWATVNGARTAIVDATTDQRYSYLDVDRDADRWQRLLQHLGVQPGDRVGMLAQNRYEFIVLFFACIRRGAVLVPLNWRLTAGELCRVLQHAEPTVVFVDDGARALLRDACGRAEPALGAAVLGLDDDVPLLWRAVDHVPVPASPTRSIDDATMLLYTSGSTGMPKAVMVPHRQLHWNAIATASGWQLGHDDVAPASTPFFHTAGWHVFATTLLARGGTVVLIGAFSPATYLELLHRYDVTVAFGVPTQFAMLGDSADWGRPLPTLRWFFSGGAPCPAGIASMVRSAGYGFREGYGLTECGPNCFTTTNDASEAKVGSTGWPIPYLQMRLRADDGAIVGTDTVGELELRGPQLFGGYFRAPEHTEAALTADGWLRTGDLATRDADGAYWIRGRRSDMFISGGENVFPGEVEAALLDCPGVREAVVVGVPDARWGEVGCALIVRHDAALSAASVLAAARARLAGYKVPQRIVFVNALPRLGSGKVDRQGAKALVV